jgi:hypothetical protein
MLTFRLEQFTESGDRRSAITVELRGRAVSGDVAVGDRVRVYGRMRDGILRAKRVQNLTTGGTAREVGQLRQRLRALTATGVALILLLVVIGLMVLFVSMASHSSPSLP